MEGVTCSRNRLNAHRLPQQKVRFGAWVLGTTTQLTFDYSYPAKNCTPDPWYIKYDGNLLRFHYYNILHTTPVISCVRGAPTTVKVSQPPSLIGLSDEEALAFAVKLNAWSCTIPCHKLRFWSSWGYFAFTIDKWTNPFAKTWKHSLQITRTFSKVITSKILLLTLCNLWTNK